MCASPPRRYYISAQSKYIVVIRVLLFSALAAIHHGLSSQKCVPRHLRRFPSSLAGADFALRYRQHSFGACLRPGRGLEENRNDFSSCGLVVLRVATREQKQSRVKNNSASCCLKTCKCHNTGLHVKDLLAADNDLVCFENDEQRP